MIENLSQNNALAALAGRAGKAIFSAIQSASAKTGVDFGYMLQQADAESSFRADAQAKTSSARGLFQFIESTWMNMMEKHGASYGIDMEGKSRSDVLKLRDDPEIASLMAAELARENKDVLQAHGQTNPGATDLYFAHFLGASGAAAFLNARDENGAQKAAYLFPEAAKANQNVFYDRGTGRAKTLDEVYAFFDAKFNLDQQIAPQIESTPQSPVFQTAKPAFKGGFNPLPITNLLSSPVELMILAELDVPFFSDDEEARF